MSESDRRDSVGQSADLRTRIAAVLVAHPDKMDGTCCGDPGLEIEVQDDWALHVADAVIRELDDMGIIHPSKVRHDNAFKYGEHYGI